MSEDKKESDNFLKYDAKEIKAIPNEECTEKVDFNPELRQLIGVSGVSIMYPLGIGMIIGYTAILFPQLKDSGEIILSKEQESWIASITPLVIAASSLLGGFIMERAGRRNTMVTCSALLLVGWVLICRATTYNILMAGRFIHGLIMGIAGSSSIAFPGEMCSPKLRGIFLSGLNLFVALGLFLVHLLGTIFNWRTVSFQCMVVPIATTVLCATIPESYVHFLKNGKYEEAKKSFIWFRGYDKDAKEEFEAALNAAKFVKDDRTIKDLLKECRSNHFIKPFCIIFIFMITMQLSGNNVVIYYTVDIMQRTVPGINSYVATLLVDSVRMAIALLATVLAKKYKLRTLSLISTFGTVVALYTISCTSKLVQYNPDNRYFTYLPLIGFLGYILIINVGLVNMPWVVCGEVLPPTMKGYGTGLVTTINYLMNWLTVKTSSVLFDYIGTGETYALYGTMTLSGGLILLRYLPETKGKTLQDIEMSFLSNKKINCEV